MNLQPINPYQIIKQLTEENEALVAKNEALEAENEALKAEVAEYAVMANGSDGQVAE